MNDTFWSCQIPGLAEAQAAAAAAAAAPVASGAFLGVLGSPAPTPQQAVTVPGAPLGAPTMPTSTPASAPAEVPTTPAPGVPATTAPASAPASAPATPTAPAPARAQGGKSKSAQTTSRVQSAVVHHSAQGETRVIMPTKAGTLSMTVTPAPGAPRPQGPVTPTSSSRPASATKRPRTDNGSTRN